LQCFIKRVKNLIWGKPKYKGHDPSAPILVKPSNAKKGDLYDEKTF